MKKLLGIDIGGTKCAVITGLYEGDRCEITGRTEFASKDFSSPSEAMEVFFQTAGDTAYAAVGISCGSPLDSRRGIIQSPPNLPGWDDVHITDFFSKRYEVPCALANDANACALAEWKFGNGRGTQNLIFLTFGTGMGAGLILDGHLYQGTNGMAGEVGHIRLAESGPVGYGKPGSFEGFCSGGGLAQLARAMVLAEIQKGSPPDFCKTIAELPGLTAKTVAEAAYQGSATARDIYRECGRYLGKGLSVLIDILNPQVIILGSIYERSGGLLNEAMYDVIRHEALSGSAGICSIMPSRLGDSLGDYAALSVAMNTLERQQ